MQDKIVIIYNPIAGKKKASKLKDSIITKFKQIGINVISNPTLYKGHAVELTQLAVNNQAQLIIILGGDGTFNEVVSNVIGSPCQLAYLPCGSGNGFSKLLTKELRTKNAVSNLVFKIINQQFKLFDYGMINDSYFFNVAGFGLDAELAVSFDNIIKRGFFNYLPVSIAKIIKIPTISIKLKVANEFLNYSGYWFSIFNGTHYGGFIKPNITGVPDDGILELIIVKNKKYHYYPAILYSMIKGITQSNHVSELIKFDKATIYIAKPNINVHFDGQTKLMQTPLDIKVIKQGLKIIA